MFSDKRVTISVKIASLSYLYLSTPATPNRFETTGESLRRLVTILLAAAMSTVAPHNATLFVPRSAFE